MVVTSAVEQCRKDETIARWSVADNVSSSDGPIAAVGVIHTRECALLVASQPVSASMDEYDTTSSG